MPIDPNIPLALLRNPPQPALQTPGESDRYHAVTEQVQLQNEGLRREQASEDALKQILEQAGGDIDVAIEQLMRVNPEMALKLREQRAQEVLRNQQALGEYLKNAQAKLDAGIRLGQTITDEMSFNRAVALAMQQDPEIARLLGPTYDPARIEQLLGAALSRKEQVELQQKALTDYAEGKFDAAATRAYASATTPEQWAGVPETMRALGVPPPVRPTLEGKYGEFSPESLQRAKADAQLLDSGNQRAGYESVDLNVGGKKTGASFDRQTGRYFVDGQQVQSPQVWREPQREPLRAIVDPETGENVLVPENEARGQQPGTSTRPVSVYQNDSLKFYQRMRQAEEELQSVEAELGDDTSVIGDAWRQNAPAFLNSSLGQRWRAAQMAFTEARLRKESGAAIAQTEYANDRSTNFVQPGDSDDTKAQKLRSRQNQLAVLAFAAGPALAEYYGDQAEAKRIINDHRKAAEVPGKDGTKAPSPPASGDGAKTPTRRNAAPAQPTGGREYRGQIPPPRVPPDVARNKPSDPKKGTRVRKREGGVSFVWTVYYDGSADREQEK